MCGSMVGIQFPTAETRRGKKRRRKIETTGQKYNGLPYYIGRPRKAEVLRRNHPVKVRGVRPKVGRESMVGKICERGRLVGV